MGLDLAKPHKESEGIFDFLGDKKSLHVNDDMKSLELEYEWDFESDPVITPTIVSEWGHLNNLLGEKVLRGAKKILSIGGGGTSQTHIYLTEDTEEFYILNPGLWDLQNAKIPKGSVRTFLIRGIAEELPFTDSSVEAIEIPATIDHLADPERALRECFRILDTGGIVGITLGNSESWYRGLVGLLKIKFDDRHDHHHNFHFSPRQVESLLVSCGFSNVETVGTAYLKMPKSIERKLGNPFALKIHNVISNVFLRRVFGDMRGGMFLTYGTKPNT